MTTLFIAVYWGACPRPSIFCRKWPWLPLLISSSKEPTFFMVSPRLSTSSLFCHVLADRLRHHLFLVYMTRISLFTQKRQRRRHALKEGWLCGRYNPKTGQQMDDVARTSEALGPHKRLFGNPEDTQASLALRLACKKLMYLKCTRMLQCWLNVWGGGKCRWSQVEDSVERTQSQLRKYH